MLLRRVDVIMTSSKMPFYCIRGEKANSVSVNNFDKIKHMFLIFCNQHYKSNMQLIVY